MRGEINMENSFMDYNHLHRKLFDDLVNDGGFTTGAKGKYVSLTTHDTQNLTKGKREGNNITLCLILYGPYQTENLPDGKNTHVHCRAEFYNDLKGGMKLKGVRYHKDVYRLFSQLEPLLTLNPDNPTKSSGFSQYDEDPYNDWLFYIVEDKDWIEFDKVVRDFNKVI